MSDAPLTEQPTRLAILLRLLYTLLYLFVFEVLKLLVQVVVLVQFLLLLVFREPNVRLQQFANRLTAYGYRLLRYVTLNENTKPFPMNDFPAELEPPTAEVRFD